MRPDEFERRMGKVRYRFTSTIESKIKRNFEIVPLMAVIGTEAAKHVSNAYRSLHEICAIAPTVGFPATGKAARAAEVILLESHLARRGLTTTEAASLRKALDALWAAAQNELQYMYSRQA